MHQFDTLAIATLGLVAVGLVTAVPHQVVDERVDAPSSTPVWCTEVSKSFLNHISHVTPFCSSLLIKYPPKAKTTTCTSTVTIETTTHLIFLPGQPPQTTSPVAKRESGSLTRDAAKFRRELKFGSLDRAQLLDACSCLDLAGPKVFAPVSETRTTVTVGKTTMTRTIYPCATPIHTLTPSLPFGQATNGSYTTSGNSKFDLSTVQGNSTESCCHACYFEVENCIQAYWYSYQGCVIEQAAAVNASGPGSNACPHGQIDGLMYGKDTSPAFRSTGDIAGPCGVVYENL